MTRSALLVALVALASACTGAAPSPDGTTADLDAASAGDALASDALTPPPEARPGEPTLAHVSAEVTVAPGEESTGQCESFTLNNETTLYVNAVEFQSGGGLHHSNWLFVPARNYPGPDGTWPCGSRGFEQVAAAASGGGVLFAQTTQATREVQQFQPGVVVPIPPRSKVIGNVHLLNASGAPLRTRYGLTLRTLPAEQVRVRLAGLALQYSPLNIPPRTRSEFATACDFDTTHRQVFQRPLDFRVYYVLPHYHALGTALRLRVLGGPHDGHVLFESSSALGEPAGRMIDPPFEMAGARGLELSCAFNNPRSTAVGWGVGDQEMCMALAFVDSAYQWAGGAISDTGNVVTGVRDGVTYNTSRCEIYAFPARGATAP